MRKAAYIALAVGVVAILSATASGELVRFGNLVLTADGSFTPRTLPRRAFAPIEFKGHANLRAVDGGVPVAVRQIVLEFDHDGRLGARGLPECDPELLAGKGPAEARSACGGSVVGEGHATAMIARPGQAAFTAGTGLTFFNGRRQGRLPTAIVHGRLLTPQPETFQIVVPIERRAGEYRYRATIDVPPIAGGFGSLVHLDGAVGRRYRFQGKRRSYLSARCGDGVLQTHGRFAFVDGSIVDGSVQRGCTVR
jgi:hypothetical protein